MRRHRLQGLVVVCLTFIGLVTQSRAATYEFSFSYNQAGEANWIFDGHFDPDIAKSGAGTLAFYPIEAEPPPSTTQLSGVQMDLSSSTGLEGVPVAIVTTDLSFGTPPGLPSIYFYATAAGYQFDSVDTDYVYAASLRLSGPSTVPLPGAAPLFGAALLGLACVGSLVRRHAGAAA